MTNGDGNRWHVWFMGGRTFSIEPRGELTPSFEHGDYDLVYARSAQRTDDHTRGLQWYGRGSLFGPAGDYSRPRSKVTVPGGMLFPAPNGETVVPIHGGGAANVRNAHGEVP